MEKVTKALLWIVVVILSLQALAIIGAIGFGIYMLFKEVIL